MANEKMEAIKAHVSGCPTCSAANGRVNDFCETGRLMFYEWMQVNPPTRIERVVLTDDQYKRLEAEQRRRVRNAGRN